MGKRWNFSKYYYKKIYSGEESFVRRIGRDWFKTGQRPKVLFKIIKHLPKSAKVLDVGCGTGTFLKTVHDIRPDLSLYGIDIAGHGDNLPGYISFHKASIFEIPFENETFDLVSLFSVIEHIEVNSIDRALSELCRILKNGGHFYIETLSSLSVLFNFYDDPTHIRPYTKFSLSMMLEQHDINVTKAGNIRQLAVLLGGLLYALVGRLKGDKNAHVFFLSHLFGLGIYAMGRKQDLKHKN